MNIFGRTTLLEFNISNVDENAYESNKINLLLNIF